MTRKSCRIAPETRVV